MRAVRVRKGRGGKERELGCGPVSSFFVLVIFLFLTEFEKRRKEIKTKVKFRVFDFSQHKMLVKL